MDDKQVRVILWSIPRTVSTAFEKCMSNLDDVQIINEPYVCAYAAGPEMKTIPEDVVKDHENFFDKAEAVETAYDAGWEVDKATYKFIKESILEAEYPGKKVVFAKDMSYAIAWKLDMLPKGYRHAFIIRNPIKVFSSWKRLLNKIIEELSPDKEYILETNNSIIPDNYAFGESFQLYEHLVKTGIEPNPVIIDSDDLLENPESILRRFCDRTGVQYTDKLMGWSEGDGVVQEWKASNAFIKGNQLYGYYKEAFASQKFYKSHPAPDRSDLAEDVKVCVDAAMPYYEKLYALRLRADDTENRRNSEFE